MTVVEPSVSTAGSRRTSAPARARRQSPAASATAVTAGSPSGIADTASVMPVSSIRPTGCPRRMPTIVTTPQMPSATPTRRRPRPSTWRSSGVARRPASTTSWPTRPSCVATLVAVSAREHGGPEICHRRVLGERGAGRHTRQRVLVDGEALPREGGLVDAEQAGADQAPVRGHLSPGLEEHEVAGDKVGRGDGPHPIVAADARTGDDERAQPGQRSAGPPLRDEADQGVEQQGGEDDEALHPFTQCHGHGRRDQQQHDHQARELRQRQPPERLVSPLGDPVGADPGQPAPGLGLRQAALDVGAEQRRHAGDVERVPGADAITDGDDRGGVSGLHRSGDRQARCHVVVAGFRGLCVSRRPWHAAAAPHWDWWPRPARGNRARACAALHQRSRGAGRVTGLDRGNVR
jgi:hypothetical protein